MKIQLIKNLITSIKRICFSQQSYLNAGYGTLYEHIGTVYQNVHTHYLIVCMKIPTHKDIPVPPQNTTRVCFFENNFKLTDWRSRAYRQCHFFNGLFNKTLLEGSHLYTKIFQVLHSDIPAVASQPGNQVSI